MDKQKKKDLQNWIDKVIKKGQPQLHYFSGYFQQHFKQDYKNYQKFLNLLTDIIDNYTSMNIAKKIAIILILSRMCKTIASLTNIQTFQLFNQNVKKILNFFNDPNDKVRFRAISSIYNLFKQLNDKCLVIFCLTFQKLPSIITDGQAQVRQGAAHLNHTMKRLLINSIANNNTTFNCQNLMNKLTPIFWHTQSLIKQFLIDWIIAIDQIKQFQSTKYLPLYLRNLFLFLDDANKNVRIKAQQCLNGFIQAFKLSFTCSKQLITKRYKHQEIQNVLIRLIKIFQQDTQFQSSQNIDIHVLSWLDSFCQFLIQEINQKLQPFLSTIIINNFTMFFRVLIKGLSKQAQNIKQKVLCIHQKLLKGYPFLYSQKPQIQKSATILNQQMIDCKTLAKTQMIIKWTNRMAQHNNQHIQTHINQSIDFVVDKLCSFNQIDLVILIDLLQGSIFTLQYFSILIHSLLKKLQKQRIPNQTGILSQVINLRNSDYNFILLCTQTSQLISKYQQFKTRLAQNLLGFLITEKSLKQFKQNIKKRKIDQNIFKSIALAFLQSKPAFIILCFLIRDYNTALFILEQINQQQITKSFMHSIFKVSNLLMHPSMHQVYLDMGSNNQIAYQARQAYASFLMFLPINRTTNPLLQKAKQLATQDKQLGFTYTRETQLLTEESLAKTIYCQRYINAKNQQNNYILQEIQ